MGKNQKNEMIYDIIIFTLMLFVIIVIILKFINAAS
jgi:hypothetical protein